MKFLFPCWCVVACLVMLQVFPLATVQAADWSAIVSPAGTTRLEHRGKEIGSLVPGLYDAQWQGAVMSEGKPDAPTVEGQRLGRIRSKDGDIVEVLLTVASTNDQVKFNYRFTPLSSIRLNSLYVGLALPTGGWAGGTYVANGQSGSLPETFKEVAIKSGEMKSLQLTSVRGDSLSFNFDKATPVLVQDDRKWGQTFSVRLGPQPEGGKVWAAGESVDVAFVLSAPGGMTFEEDRPVTIAASSDWLPLNATLDVEPGSALDFSQVIPRHSPAGKYGRVIVNTDGKFAFADQPKKAVRFYGVNLCFSAQFLSHQESDQLAERLWRLGYNALRIHHYESELVDRSTNRELRLKRDKLDQLDYLLAAMKRRGIYVTTDLFVSRPVNKSLLYPQESDDGTDIEMNDYKMAVHFNDRAYNDFKAFSKALLDHVNPYTGLRYAEDPMLAWLSLVNENCPGNFIAELKGPLRDEWQLAWNQWLAKKFVDRESLAAALGEDLTNDQDPVRGNVPMQNVYAGTSAATTFNVFLAETEREFFSKTRDFLRQELGCDALLTDMNAWTNPVQMQAVRGQFDYVDDHFYIDHPQFLEKPWALPSSCPNTSPILDGALGGVDCAFTRLFGKPFTITEFNYSSPGRFRGVGGILTGALGAIQDWDGVWRFAYAHNRSDVSKPGPLNYFDVAADPLNQAAERASLCLFLRGDIQPARHSVSIDADDDTLLRSPTTSRSKTPDWKGMAWLTRVGWSVSEQQQSDSEKSMERLLLPIDGKDIPPFTGIAEKQIFSEIKNGGWLSSNNQTDFAKNRFQSESGEVTIDAPENTLILDTARTAGGFAPAGSSIETRGATIEIIDTDATLWISSLDENPITTSKRLLITHLTDLQNSGARYGDRGRKVLLDWGRLPHLVQAGSAIVSLRLADASKAKVFGLSTSGERVSEIKTTIEGDFLVVPIQVDANGTARLLYEVVVGN